MVHIFFKCSVRIESMENCFFWINKAFRKSKWWILEHFDIVKLFLIVLDSRKSSFLLYNVLFIYSAIYNTLYYNTFLLSTQGGWGLRFRWSFWDGCVKSPIPIILLYQMLSTKYNIF
jgi:hypothetical protein